jgi:hypothetical protein
MGSIVATVTATVTASTALLLLLLPLLLLLLSQQYFATAIATSTTSTTTADTAAASIALSDCSTKLLLPSTNEVDLVAAADAEYVAAGFHHDQDKAENHPYPVYHIPPEGTFLTSVSLTD